MFRRKRLFILIPALFLIPILAGMIPLKLANKLAHGGPYTQCQDNHGCGHKNCSAHSLISQNHFEAEAVNSSSPDPGLCYSQESLGAVPESAHPSIQPLSIPLRC
jgi:hypothetical protein